MSRSKTFWHNKESSEGSTWQGHRIKVGYSRGWSVLPKDAYERLLEKHCCQSVLVSVEDVINNRPLAHLDEELGRQVLTPNMLLKGKDTNATYVEEDVDQIHWLVEEKVLIRDNLRKK